MWFQALPLLKLRLASSQSMDETEGMYGTLGCKGLKVFRSNGPSYGTEGVDSTSTHA